MLLGWCDPKSTLDALLFQRTPRMHLTKQGAHLRVWLQTDYLRLPPVGVGLFSF